jgi:hypothetical protein
MATTTEQYEEVIRKLLAKSVAKKVDWSVTAETGTFLVAVDQSVSFEISNARATNTVPPFRKVIMRDANGDAVFDLIAVPPSERTSQANDERWELLKSLWDEARTIALKLDEKISLANAVLDKL